MTSISKKTQTKKKVVQVSKSIIGGKPVKKIGHHIKRAGKKTASSTGVAAGMAKNMAVGEAPKTETPDRITTETVAEHRKEVLSTSRRFIYPLTHSKHKIAIISGFLFILAVLSIFGGTALMLYRYQRTDDFAYRVSQIVPYPVARVDGDFVSYEDYLFEVRQNVHFYTTQENIDFDDEEGQAILKNIKAEALQRVKENAVARKLADANGLSVDPEEVDRQIDIIRKQGGIGDSDEALDNTLKRYYNWTTDDFRGVVELQILKQKLISVLDTEAFAKIASIENKLADGGDFAKIAKAESQDPFSKDKGGKLGSLNRASTDFPPIFIEAAFSLEKGQVSEVVQSSVGLHVIKNFGPDKDSEDQILVSHILIRFKDVTELLRTRVDNVEVSNWISLDGQGDTNGEIESRPQTNDVR